MDKTTIYLPRELHDELKAVATRFGLAQSEVVREALAAYLAQQETSLPQTIGMGESESVQGADYEDLLRRRWKRDW